MKKLMFAAVGAVALGLTASAWDAGIGNYTSWPQAGWTNTDGTELTGTAPSAKLDVDADEAAPLTYAAVAKTLGTGDDDVSSVTFTSTIQFEPFAEMPTVPADAKVGVVSYLGNYWVLEKDGDNNANVWSQTTAAAEEGEVTVAITLTKDGQATYSVGGTVIATKTVYLADMTVGEAKYAGSGIVAALSGSYVANAVVFEPTALSGTTMTVTANDEELEAPYKAAPGATLVVTYKADEGKLFANGEDTYVYNGTVAEGAIATGVDQQGLTKAVAKNECKDVGETTKYYLTLGAAVQDLEMSETIELIEDYTAAEDEVLTFEQDACVQIKYGKTLTLPAKLLDAKTFKVEDGATVEFSGGTIAMGDSYYGLQVYGTAKIDCTVTKGLDQGPLFDIYNSANVTVNDGADLSSAGDIFRFKSAGTAQSINEPEVEIWGGKLYSSNGNGMFYLYKQYVNPIVTIYDGEITSTVKMFGKIAAAGDGDYQCELDGECTAKFSGTAGVADYVADGFYLVKKGGWYVVTDEVVAKIGTEFYASLGDAFKAAVDGDTIKVLADTAVANTIVITNSVTLDATEINIACTAKYPFRVEGANAALTITDGLFNQDVENGIILWARNGGTITVNGGEFNAIPDAEIAYVQTADAYIYIYGGTFVMADGGDVLNVAQTLGVLDTKFIQCFGGSFSKDPAEGDDALGPTFVAKGYQSTLNADTGLYDVTEQQVAKIGEKTYKTLEAAAADSADGDTITLLTDVTTTERVYFNQANDVTVDLNGKTVSSSADECFVMGESGEPGAGTLTITGNGRVIQTYAGEDADVVWARLGNVVISNGYYEVNGSYQCVYATRGSTVKIYGGTFKNVTTKTEAGYGDVLNVNNDTSVVTDIQCFGGSFSKDPATGDDALKGTFVASGYQSKLNAETGLYDVEEQMIEPIDPTVEDVVKCDSAEEAEILAAAITLDPASFVKAPDAVTDPDDVAKYKSLFQGRAYDKGAEHFVFIELTDEAIEDLEAEASTNTVTKTVADALVEPTATQATISGTTAGFFYFVEGSDTPDFEDIVQGEAVLATAAGQSLTLDKPMGLGKDGKAFYKIGLRTQKE